MDKACLNSMKYENGTVYLEVLSNTAFMAGNRNELRVLEVEGPGRVVLKPKACSGDYCVYTLELGKGGNLAPLDKGFYRFYVDDSKEPLKADLFSAFDCKDDSHRNIFSRVKGGALELEIRRVWGPDERTIEARRKNAVEAYAEFRKLPIDENKIFFESMHTRLFNDSPRAIYEELAKQAPRWTLVWGLENDKTDIGPAGIVARHNSLEYWRHLATAKYIVSNVNQYRLVKRPGQVVINTMHGIPLKRMGLISTKDEQKIAAMRRVYEHDWDIFISPCDYLSDILRGESYNFKGQIIQVGYPRNDVLVNKANDEQTRQQVRERLGVPEGKKLILYAPTYRKKTKLHILLDFEALRARLSDEYCVAFRSHYMVTKFIDPSMFDDFILDGNVVENANDMLIGADVLITDYSSIMFDFSIMKRPIILLIPDWKRYTSTRGTYFDLIEEYPELVALTSDDVVDMVLHPERSQGALLRFAQRFTQYETGHASRDAVEAIWGL